MKDNYCNKSQFKVSQGEYFSTYIYSINLDKISLSSVFNQFMNCMSYSSTEKHKSLTSVGAHCSSIVIIISCSRQFSLNEALLNGQRR